MCCLNWHFERLVQRSDCVWLGLFGPTAHERRGDVAGAEGACGRAKLARRAPAWRGPLRRRTVATNGTNLLTVI